MNNGFCKSPASASTFALFRDQLGINGDVLKKESVIPLFMH